MMFSSSAFASEILNGDFDDGLNDWTVEQTSGSVTDGGGFALLEDSGGGAAVAFLPSSTLLQSFVVADSGAALSFDFSFSTTSTSNSGTDTFAVSIVSGDFIDPLVDILFVSEGLGVQVDPFVAGLTVTYAPGPLIAGFAPLAGESFSGQVTLLMPDFLVGDLVTLYFDLNDNDLDPAIATRAAVDNVGIGIASVPEPAPLALMLTGLLALTRLRGKRD